MISGPPQDSRYQQTFVVMAHTKKGSGHQARPVGVYSDSILAMSTCKGLSRYHAMRPEREDIHALDAWYESYPLAPELHHLIDIIEEFNLLVVSGDPNPPKPIGYVSAGSLRKYQRGETDSLEMTRDVHGFSESRQRGGEPVAVYIDWPPLPDAK